MDLAKFYNQFREETTENIRVLNDGLLALENNSDPADLNARSHLDAIFRAMHTIKGSARLLGFGNIGHLAHKMEDVLGAVREGKFPLNRDLTDRLLSNGDVILDLASYALENGGSDEKPDVDVHSLIAALEQSTHQPSANVPPGQSAEGEPSSADAVPASTADTAAPAETVEQAEPVSAAMPAAAATVQDTTTTPKTREPGGTTSGRSPMRTRSSSRETVRVRTDRLDRLINLTGELVIGQQVLSLHSQALRELVALNQQQERVLMALHTELREQYSTSSPEMVNHEVNTLLNTCDQMRQILRAQTEQFTQYINQHHSLVDDLEQEVIATRLLPVSTVFAALPRAVRELANTTGKEVSLELHGETTELDRKLLEALNDPLLHIVRNAIDHGIEPPDEREAVGKPRQGRVQVRAEALGGEVRIIISDDGRGMQADKMREIGVNKGLISAENAALLSDQEALELIFLPGFTTAQILTDISGRGVGMDVVRTNISELSGQVLLSSQQGQGTTITLLLPLTLVTTRIVLVCIGSQIFALPATGCRGIMWVHQDDISTIENRAMVEYQGATVPVLRLADLIGIEAEQAFQQDERMPAIILGNEQRMLSLLVDSVVDERESVVKPVGPMLEMQRRYTGAVQLGDGQLVLMLNPMALAQAARGVRLTPVSRSVDGIERQPRLLVADDSFTTRELIRSILHSAGYNVAAAVDGADALDKLRAQPYDLVVSDVEMPRMNGFELTRNIRQEAGLQDLPVIIITSLASDEHRRQGLESGAQAYIVKSQFNQDNLLNAIQQLLGS